MAFEGLGEMRLRRAFVQKADPAVRFIPNVPPEKRGWEIP